MSGGQLHNACWCQCSKSHCRALMLVLPLYHSPRGGTRWTIGSGFFCCASGRRWRTPSVREEDEGRRTEKGIPSGPSTAICYGSGLCGCLEAGRLGDERDIHRRVAGEGWVADDCTRDGHGLVGCVLTGSPVRVILSMPPYPGANACSGCTTCACPAWRPPSMEAYETPLQPRRTQVLCQTLRYPFRTEQGTIARDILPFRFGRSRFR